MSDDGLPAVEAPPDHVAAEAEAEAAIDGLGEPHPAQATEAPAPSPESASSVTGRPPPPPPPPPKGMPAASDAADVVELLAKIHIFAGLQPAYLRRIAAVGIREQHPLGATVFAEGAEGDKMYLILSGAVRISRRVPGMGEEALAVLRAGNYFGEMSLVDESPRSADAMAHEATELLVLKKDDLEDLLFVDRDLAYDLLWNFVRTLTSRLRDTNDKMTFLAVTNRF
jgi:hypothetical protein